MSDRTIYQMFQETVSRHGDRPALGYRQGKEPEHRYLRYRELAERVTRVRRGLDALGLRRGDTLAILSENRPEWAIADLAAQSLGIVIVAPYVTLPAAQTGFIIADSQARAIIVADAKQLAKLKEFRNNAPNLEWVLALDGSLADGETVLSFESLETAPGKSEAELDALSTQVSADDLATLIYTSGTTGEPKGAMLTHRNLLFAPESIHRSYVSQVNEHDVLLSFLPLSHITERVGYYFPIMVGACIVYSQGLSSLTEEIQKTVRPTTMICVPRLWENIYAKAKEALAKRDPKDQKKIEWALALGAERSQRLSAGKRLSLFFRLKYAIAHKLILSKLHEKITGGRLRHAVSGGAPLPHEVATFFLSIGVHTLEGYGLSETSIFSINPVGLERPGTVGKVLPDAHLRFAEDGEILLKSPGLMKGYHGRPEDTKEAIDAEGWFHTGDIGELSSDGYLKITDRKKDILVLSNGKKVAPQPLEAELKRSDWIAEAVLFGDRQPTVSAILVPAFDHLKRWAKERELPSETEALLAHPETQKALKAEIDKVNSGLPDYERIKRFRLVPRPFSIETGELTPTLKVRRKVVAEKYGYLLKE